MRGRSKVSRIYCLKPKDAFRASAANYPQLREGTKEGWKEGYNCALHRIKYPPTNAFKLRVILGELALFSENNASLE
jgi:hypothetical protein